MKIWAFFSCRCLHPDSGCTRNIEMGGPGAGPLKRRFSMGVFHANSGFNTMPVSLLKTMAFIIAPRRLMLTALALAMTDEEAQASCTLRSGAT